MKRIIALVLILIITPFFIHSDKSLNLQAEEIRIENSKNPKTANWEYIKDRAFDNVGNLKKGYDKPVVINLKDYTQQDSIIVYNFVREIGKLTPNVEIEITTGNIARLSHHYIYLEFEEKKYPDRIYTDKKDLNDGSTIFRSKPGFMTSSDSSEYSNINFKFIDTITDYHRKFYIQRELVHAIFSTTATDKLYNNLFSVQHFNPAPYEYTYGPLSDHDKFLLKKVYSADFEAQFKDYLYEYYPWRYAFSFSDKKKLKLLAAGIVGLLGAGIFILLFGAFQRKRFTYSFLNYFIPVFLIISHFVNLDLIYNSIIEFGAATTWQSMILSLTTYVPIYALLASFIMWVTDKFILKEDMNFSFQFILQVLSTFIAFNLPILFILLWKSQFEWNDFLSSWFFCIALPVGRGILIYLNHFSDNLIKQKDVELSQLKEAHAQSELKLLQLHINPHFLYNALNSIAGLAKDDSDKTERMALSLSDLFRYSINKKGEKMSTVAEEVALVENYLEIEKIRFGDRLKFTLKVDEAAKEEKIPMFMLQPLVENAIKHGVSKIGSEARVCLSITKEKEELLISVSDNGPGFPEGLVSGHGLQIVYDLLRLSYGKNASLRWENSPKKQILISIKKSNTHD